MDHPRTRETLALKGHINLIRIPITGFTELLLNSTNKWMILKEKIFDSFLRIRQLKFSHVSYSAFSAGVKVKAMVEFFHSKQNTFQHEVFGLLVNKTHQN